MKLSLPQLEQNLKQRLAKIYLICGEEPFLIQETLSLLRQKALSAGFTERTRIDIETDADLEKSYSHAYTTPFFAQGRLLELHWKGKPSKAGQQFLEHYALHPSPHSLLVICMGKIDSRTEQSSWFKILEKPSVHIPIWPLPQKQLPSWILGRAKKQKLDLTPEAVQLLAHHVEGNLQAAAQEIEKLSLSGLELIDRQAIVDLVLDQGCFSAFDLVDQALAGKGSQVLRILHYLQHEGSEALLILGAFTFELRIAVKIAKDLKGGENLSTLFTRHRVRQARQESLRHFLNRSTDQSLFNLFIKAEEIDRLAKGALQGNVWAALEDFCLAVAGIDILCTPERSGKMV